MSKSNHIGVARALSDPARLDLLMRLFDGPATVTELVSVTGLSQPNVSNHLAVLREEGLVKGDRAGRQVRYQLANPLVAQLVEGIVAVAGSPPGRPGKGTPLAEARTCYDHLAGRLGVAVLQGLINKGALGRARRGGSIDLGDKAEEVFDRLGVDLESVVQGRRRFAFSCLDWTERRAHLGGALGAEVLARFLDAGWVAKRSGTRAVLLTDRGRNALARTLEVSI